MEALLDVKMDPCYEIQKVKVKNNQLAADYEERYVDENYKNDVCKSSEQYVHKDLLYALSLLKTHVAAICEMAEASNVNIDDPSEFDLDDTLKNIVVTGYSRGGSDESEGVCIIAQKLLKSGQVLNLTVPFTKFRDESGEGYAHSESLKKVIDRCDYEVDAYLFGGKYGLKQEEFDFDIPEDSGITEDAKPRKRGRKKKEGVVENIEDLR